jgi:hypothetical protein
VVYLTILLDLNTLFSVKYDERERVGKEAIGVYYKNLSEAHPASYPMGTGGSFPGGKAAKA